MSTRGSPHYLLIEADQQQVEAVRSVFEKTHWQQCVKVLSREQFCLLNREKGELHTGNVGQVVKCEAQCEKENVDERGLPDRHHLRQSEDGHTSLMQIDQVQSDKRLESEDPNQGKERKSSENNNNDTYNYSDEVKQLSNEKRVKYNKLPLSVTVDDGEHINNSEPEQEFSGTAEQIDTESESPGYVKPAVALSKALWLTDGSKDSFFETFSSLENYLNSTKVSMLQMQCLNPELEKLFNNYMQVTRLFCQTVGNIDAQRKTEGERPPTCEQGSCSNACSQQEETQVKSEGIRTVNEKEEETSTNVRSRLAKVIANRVLSKEIDKAANDIKIEQGMGPTNDGDTSDTDSYDDGANSDESTDTASPRDGSAIKDEGGRARTRKWGVKTETDFQCPYCDSFYVNSRTMRRHIFKKHPDHAPRFICDICHKQFTTRDSLRRHGREAGHMGTKPESFQCELCGKCLKRYDSYLKHHERIHVNKYQYPCEECGRLFNAIDTVKAHKRRVHSNNPTPCDVCGKMFPQRLAMLCHRRRHDEKKRTHRCNQCGKAFFNLQPLKIHMRIHTGEKPYKCTMCTYACTCRANLTKHLKIHKKQEVPDVNVGSVVNATENWPPPRSLQF